MSVIGGVDRIEVVDSDDLLEDDEYSDGDDDDDLEEAGDEDVEEDVEEEGGEDLKNLVGMRRWREEVENKQSTDPLLTLKVK